MSQFNDKLNEIKKSFYSLIEHPYLESYITDPEVDEDKVRFLYAMLHERVPNREAKMFTISVLLVQAALDVHEAVSLHKIKTDSLRKNRQLMILAGDYYSSLYYYLLAENKHLPMIQVFSHTIQEINEFKMNLYGSENLTYDEAQQNVTLIESILMQNIAGHFDQLQWKAVINDYFFLKRLLFERKEWLGGKIYPLIQSILREVSQTEEVLHTIEQKVEDVKDRLLTNSKALQSFESFVVEHVDELLGCASFHEKVAEER